MTAAPLDQVRALAELERRKLEEQCRYYVPNGRIEQWLNAISRRFPVEWISKGRTIVCGLRAQNGLGKTCVAVNLASYLADSYPNPWFDAVPYLREFPRPNRGRILTTKNAAENNYDAEFKKWLRHGKYKSAADGKNFQKSYTFQSGSEFDIFTFDQDPEAGESITLRWAIVDEPMKRRHWKALKSRFRFGGIIFVIFTPLEGSEWYEEVFEDPERLNDDVLMMDGGDPCANCLEHGIRGIIPHAALEDMWRDFEEDDLPARKEGRYLHHAGAIYKNYRDDETGHVLPTLPPYYADCWEQRLFTLWQVIDPHDRKPWFISWWAAFPNGKRIAVGEWPDISMKPFHRIKSWNYGYDAYARLTYETEKAWGVTARATIFDPNYAPSAAMNAEGVTSIAAEFYKSFKTVSKLSRSMIFPSDALTPGHMDVKGALGEPARGVTPDLYIMEHCRNLRFALKHYGWKEKKSERDGLSEAPTLQYKDGADNVRYFVVSKAGYIPASQNEDDVVLFRPIKRPGYCGA